MTPLRGGPLRDFLHHDQVRRLTGRLAHPDASAPAGVRREAGRPRRRAGGCHVGILL